MSERWLLDEMAHAGDGHLDRDFVAGYDRKQGSVPGEDAEEDINLLRDHGLGERSTVVDLGAGTGRFAVAAAAAFGRVVAVELSPAMLDALRERVAGGGRANVEVVRAGFLTYEHAGPAADAVHTRNALHQLPDFWKALALDRIAGFLRTGGVLRLRDLIYDFAPHEAGAAFARWFASAATDPLHGYTAGDLAEHVRTEHSTFRWLLEPMLGAAGFEVVGADFRGSVYGAYTCVKR